MNLYLEACSRLTGPMMESFAGACIDMAVAAQNRRVPGTEVCVARKSEWVQIIDHVTDWVTWSSMSVSRYKHYRSGSSRLNVERLSADVRCQVQIGLWEHTPSSPE